MNVDVSVFLELGQIWGLKVQEPGGGGSRDLMVQELGLIRGVKVQE